MHARLVLLSFAILMAGVTATAAAAEGLYLAGTGGATRYDRSKAEVAGTGVGVPFDVDDGWEVLGSVGWDFGPVRVEGEGGYRENDISVGTGPSVDGSLALTTAMINVFVDIPITDNFQIYVGGGAGQAFSAFHLDTIGKENDDSFAYQGMAGVAYQVEHITFFGGYRYFAVNDDLDASGGLRMDGPIIHSIEGGIRFTF